MTTSMSTPTMTSPARVNDLKTFTASVPPSQIPIFLHNKLHPLLPCSLPLYRRCQFFLYQLSLEQNPPTSTSRSSQPEIWIAVSQPVSTTNQLPQDNWLDTWLHQTQPQPSPTHANDAPNTTSPQSVWLSCHIDLHEPGQTQIWTFGTWEVTPTPEIMSTITATVSKSRSVIPTPQQIALGHALFHHLRANHIPHLPTTPSQQYLTMKAAGKVVSSPYKRSKILFGAIAEASWWLLEDNVVRCTDEAVSTPSRSGSTSTHSAGVHNMNRQKTSVISREDRPYLKYILRLPVSVPAAQTAISSSKFRVVALSPAHLQTVLDRSSIPRTLELLLTLPAIGVVSAGSDQDPSPVAWGILSKDASISSLHTEAEHRGQGLAEVVSRELVRVTAQRFRSDWLGTRAMDAVNGGSDGGDGMEEVMYAHTDVSADNVASRRVFEKMGAEVWWRVGWVEVDVDVDFDGDDNIVGT